MRIGIDVDGVLANQVPHLLRLVEQKLGIRKRKRDIRLWNQPIGNTHFEEEMEKALLDRDFVLTMPIIKGSKEALRRLASRHHIVIVTSRRPEIDDITVQWLISRGFAFHQFRNMRHAGKGELPVDILVDDRIENVKDFALTNRVAILFSQPWNRNHITIAKLLSHGKVICASGWTEVEHAIGRVSRAE